MDISIFQYRNCYPVLLFLLFLICRCFYLQIPDLEGNDYCLNLYKASFGASKWLNCLERCTSHGEYNIIAYNTPTGIFLQTVRDVVPGQQLCVAYDREYGEISHFSIFLSSDQTGPWLAVLVMLSYICVGTCNSLVSSAIIQSMCEGVFERLSKLHWSEGRVHAI